MDNGGERKKGGRREGMVKDQSIKEHSEPEDVGQPLQIQVRAAREEEATRGNLLSKTLEEWTAKGAAGRSREGGGTLAETSHLDSSQ